MHSNFRSPLSLVRNSGQLTWVRNSSSKSSATHSYLCVQYFHGSKQRYGRPCLGFLTCTQMLRHAIAHRGCMDCTGSWLGEKNPLLPWGLKPALILSGFSVRCTTNRAIPIPNSLSPYYRLGYVCYTGTDACITGSSAAGPRKRKGFPLTSI